MTEDELELKILQRYVEQHRKAGPDDSSDVKRAQELDLREVLRELTGKAGDELNYDAKMWFTRLVQRPSAGIQAAPLRPGKSGQPYGARAFLVGGSGPAWDRVRELERLLRPIQTASASHITINIQGSTVASLNLGDVIGNIEASVTTLQQDDPEIATALQKLIEATAADESLGNRRREAIESLSQIAEEATKPVSQRRIGLVRTLLVGVGLILTHSANVAQVWQTFGPAISRHFKLPWP